MLDSALSMSLALQQITVDTKHEVTDQTVTVRAYMIPSQL